MEMDVMCKEKDSGQKQLNRCKHHQHTTLFTTIVIHYNNNDNNQSGVIIRPLYVNILPAYKFDTSILSSVSREVVNQLQQIVCKPIKICKSVLDTTIKLRREKLYNNNNDILLVHKVCTFISYHENPVEKSSNYGGHDIAH